MALTFLNSHFGELLLHNNECCSMRDGDDNNSLLIMLLLSLRFAVWSWNPCSVYTCRYRSAGKFKRRLHSAAVIHGAGFSEVQRCYWLGLLAEFRLG